jgi:hypothetical protein
VAGACALAAGFRSALFVDRARNATLPAANRMGSQGLDAGKLTAHHAGRQSQWFLVYGLTLNALSICP